MDKEQVRALLEKYRTGTLTDEELAVLESWYLHRASDHSAKPDNQELELNLKLVQQAVMAQTSSGRFRFRYFWGAAAAVLIMITAAVWFFTDSRQAPADAAEITGQNDVLPGGNRAQLTLADGRTIDLNQAQTGITINNDHVIYNDGSQEIVNLQSSIVNNLTLTTPKGGTYSITLPDGTKVWLNAASTLKYPSRFDGAERVVELEGEAYFEVRKGIPFVVKSKGQKIRVLGTAFNVSAYSDEATVKTALVNGSVSIRVDARGEEVLLNPGEEAVLSGTGIATRRADLAAITAWKDGRFRFNETELHDILAQLSRWYDLEVEYHGTIPETYFYGIISRNRSLSAVLEVLKEGGVNFKIQKEGGINKLIVLPESIDDNKY